MLNVLTRIAGKIHILNIMSKKISLPRTDKKENTPVSKELVVPIEKRSKLIGVGGVNIRRITSNTGRVFKVSCFLVLTLY